MWSRLVSWAELCCRCTVSPPAGDFTHPAGLSSIPLTTTRLCRRVAEHFNPDLQMAPLTGKKKLQKKRLGGGRGRKWCCGGAGSDEPS